MNETIAAISSGMTASGIGIIRISGPEAFAVLKRWKPEYRKKIRRIMTGQGGHLSIRGRTIPFITVIYMTGGRGLTSAWSSIFRDRIPIQLRIQRRSTATEDRM